MADDTHGSSTASSGAVKVIVASAAAIVVVLVVVKQLDFTPSKVTTPSMSVEFQAKNGGMAPPSSEGSARHTEDLDKKVRQLEEQLKASAAAANTPATGRSSPAEGFEPTTRPSPAPAPVTIAGQWRSSPFNFVFAQMRNNVTMQVYANGMLTAAGQGVLSGNALVVDYLNNAGVQGRMVGTVSADGARIEVVDYGRGYPQPAVLTR